MAIRAQYKPAYVRYYETTTNETVSVIAPFQVYEDFNFKTIDTGMWTALDTAGGAETKVDDSAGGHASIALDNTSEAQLAGYSWGDDLALYWAAGVQFEARFKLTVLPTSGTIFCIGLQSAHNATADTVADNAWIRAEGNGVLVAETDDGTTDTDDKSTGVTLTTSDWCIVRIDCTSLSDVQFYINGSRVAASQTFSLAALTTEGAQPVFRLNKASGTSVGTCVVDYVRVWQNRV